MDMQPLIYDLSLKDLQDRVKALGQPGFRAKQVWVAVYQSLKTSVFEITTLPKEFRRLLADHYDFKALEEVATVESGDGHTQKSLFRLRDGNLIETVLMGYENRQSVCISSQSGCGLGCAFCATGQMGFHRNLTSGEIIAQVLHFERLLAQDDKKLTNVVLMGMGEPFLNYDNVLEALYRLNHPDGFGLGARRFTISTVGIVPKIKQFADAGTQYNLAISLHTVNDELRSELIPSNKKFPIDSLLRACQYYIQKTNRRVTFEVALIEGVNDSISDAEALSEKLSGMLCHVNLIALNPTPGFGERPATSNQAEAFCNLLNRNHIPCTIRLRRGNEIQAGCGQLAAKAKDI